MRVKCSQYRYRPIFIYLLAKNFPILSPELRIPEMALSVGVSAEPDAQHRQERMPDKLHLRAGRGHDPESRPRPEPRKLLAEGAELQQVRLRRTRLRDRD